METVLLGADDTGVLDRAVELIVAGEVVAFPTDTVYGVGCNVWSEPAIRKLFNAKQRPMDLSIPVLVSSIEGIRSVTHSEVYVTRLKQLAAAFWPGALTLVLPAREELPRVLLGGRDTVAVRMPDHPFALDLIQRLGGAMAVTSANISGQQAPQNAEETFAALKGRIPLIVDGGACKMGVASTIVDLTSAIPVVLRAGGLSIEALRQVLPELA